ncbi:hypothetical protein M752DRAFT_302313 [Aspergillus phoenicis ATCC 13157]|uniref:Uncharacterized protein n=1 Tax=Aspergillus phoenicis ATCC 13157 TaxID=1353007 RepID=A0A370PHQ5_ASPPH|nr:hypothetical protein M752DRAFT_302313 [Aspergillus phoenicis ATCC 13157]
MVLRYHPCPSISEFIPDEDTLKLYRQYELTGHNETGLSGLSLKEKQVIERLQARQQDLPLLNMLLQALRIPGLRPGFMAGNINRLLRMKCPHCKEHAHYIQHILNVWTYIMSPQHVFILDAESVRLLQGRSPVWSTTDHDFIRRLLSVGVLFPGVTDPEGRALLARRLLSVATIIPSLRTFMEDTKYLLPCALALRRLIPDAPGDTIQACLWHYYSAPEPHTTNGRVAFLHAYRRLWLFTMRCFPHLVSIMPLRDRRGAARRVHRSREKSKRCWTALAHLAWSQGFRTPKIAAILQQWGFRSVQRQRQGHFQEPHLTRNGTGPWKMRHRPDHSVHLLSPSLCREPKRVLATNGSHLETDRRRTGAEPLLHDVWRDGNTPGQRIKYSPSSYGSPAASSHGEPARRPLFDSAELVRIGDSNPFSSSTTRIDSPHPPYTPVHKCPPTAVSPVAGPSHSRLGLLGWKTRKRPQDLPPPRSSGAEGKGILYEMGTPATVYYLPLPRARRLFKQYLDSHPHFVYARLTSRGHRLVDPAAVPSHLKHAVVIAGPKQLMSLCDKEDALMEDKEERQPQNAQA